MHYRIFGRAPLDELLLLDQLGVLLPAPHKTTRQCTFLQPGHDLPAQERENAGEREREKEGTEICDSGEELGRWDLGQTDAESVLHSAH